VCSALKKVSRHEIQTETGESTQRALNVPVGVELSGRWRDVLVFTIWLLVFTVLGWVILFIM
jgi:hypothetical protein